MSNYLAAWNLLLSMIQVPFGMKSTEAAAIQIEAILENTDFFGNDLVVVKGT
jgi:hypothetical protein